MDSKKHHLTIGTDRVRIWITDNGVDLSDFKESYLNKWVASTIVIAHL
jgi:hypothetical protein